MKSDRKAWKRFHEKMLSYEKLEYTRSQIASLLSNVWRFCEWEDTWPSCRAGGGGGGIWRDFVELEAEAVALVVRLPQPLKAHSSRPQSIVTTILSSNIKKTISAFISTRPAGQKQHRHKLPAPDSIPEETWCEGEDHQNAFCCPETATKANQMCSKGEMKKNPSNRNF